MKERANSICRSAAGMVTQYKSLVIMAVYAVFYLAAFFYLEKHIRWKRDL